MRFRKFQNTTGKPLQWYSYTIAVVYPSCFEIYENASQTGSQRNLRCMFSRLTEHTSAVTNKEVFIIFEFNGFIQRFPLHLQCCYTTLWSCEIRKSKNVTEFSLWNPVQAYSCQLPAAMRPCSGMFADSILLLHVCIRCTMKWMLSLVNRRSRKILALKWRNLRVSSDQNFRRTTPKKWRRSEL